MSDGEHGESDRHVVCPRCEARTRQGVTPVGRVCEACSRRVFAVPFRRLETPGQGGSWERVGLALVFGSLLAVTWTLLGDGLSSFDPVVVVAMWVTFATWGLAPSRGRD